MAFETSTHKDYIELKTYTLIKQNEKEKVDTKFKSFKTLNPVLNNLVFWPITY